MSKIQNWLPDATFTAPNGQDVNGVLTTVPDVTGLPFDQAKQQLESAGYVVNDGGYVDSSYATDTVAYTSPGAGGQIGSGTTITVYRSDGTPAPTRTGGGGNGGPGGGGNGGPGNGGGNGHGNGHGQGP
jgi:beta-lactam-binding protein with PASTA domain